MLNLLRANFARLWKTKSFWVCLILEVGLSVANFLTTYSVQPGCVETLGAELTSGCSNVLFFSSIFAALYLGTDYSNGTIRNKLIIGHTRCNIYFSNLITTAVGGLLIMAAAWSAVLVIGLCLGGGIGVETGKMLLMTAIAVCAEIAMCAFFTLLGMLISSKSTTTVITLVSAFALIIGAAIIMALLQEPEFVPFLEITADDGTQQLTYEPNPAYIGEGPKRDILTAVNDILPSGQAMQLETGSPHNAELMPLYSLGVLAVTTTIGAVVFRRKDLR